MIVVSSLSSDGSGGVRLRSFLFTLLGRLRERFLALACGVALSGSLQAQLFPIALDEAVTHDVPARGAGRLDVVGEMDIYTFAGRAGETVYFQHLEPVYSALFWALYEESGKALAGGSLNQDLGRLTLPSTGEYEIDVYGESTATGTYSFKAWRVIDRTLPLLLDEAATDGVLARGAGAIEIPGSQDVYTFDAQAGQIVYLRRLAATNAAGWENTNSLVWALIDPHGQGLAAYNTGTDLGRVTLPIAGSYRLSVGSFFGGTGAYRFQMNSVQDQSFTLNLKDVVTNGVPGAGAGNIEMPGAQDVYSFTVQAGQTLYVQRLEGTERLGWTLYLPDGQYRTAANLDSDLGRITLTDAGTYRLVVQGNRDGTGPYSFRFWEPTDRNYTLSLNDVPAAAAGNLATPGDMDFYSFEGQAGQSLYLRHETGTAALFWTLLDPRGLSVAGTSLNADIGQVTLSDSGTYRIMVSSAGNGTGAYSFQLWEAHDQSFTLTLNDRVIEGFPAAGAGNIETPGARDLYSFNVQTGQVAYLLRTEGASALRWTLYPPQDPRLPIHQEPVRRGLDADLGRVPSGIAGVCELVVEGVGAATGTYGFRLTDGLPSILSPPESRTVREGTPVTFSVAVESFFPVTYQWRKDERELPGATNRMFDLPRTSQADAGRYSVAVRNEAGSIASVPAVLTVQAGSPAPSVRPDTVKFNADRTFEFSLSVPSGARVAIETSTDLRVWTTAKEIASEGTVLFFRSEATDAAARFYRARVVE